MMEEGAIAYGQQVLAEHNLSDWQVVVRVGKMIDNGYCWAATVYGEKTIFLRLRDVLGHSDDQVKKIIRHELAHALAGAEAGHGREWQAIADRLGVPVWPYTRTGRLRRSRR